MAIITDLKPQKNADRVSIFLDGEFFSGAQALTVMTHRLKVGQEIDTASLAALVTESESARAFELALKLTAARRKTESEIKSYLLNKGFGESIVMNAVERLKEYGYASDAEYAKSFVSFKKQSSGRRRLKYELQRKGIEGNQIEDALERLSEEDELSAAQRCADKYMRGKEYTRDNLAKLYRHLAYRGFGQEIINSVMHIED